MNYIRSIFYWFLFLGLHSAYAQKEDSRQDDLSTEHVNVVQEYKPTIMDAFKLNENPVVYDSVASTPKLSYQLINKKFDKEFELETITPAKMKGEPLSKLYKNYIKAGLGNYSTPYAELFFNSARKKEYAVGIRAKHLSSSFTSKDLGFAGFSDNLIEGNGKYIFKDKILSGAVDYSYNTMHYYGVDRIFSDTILDKNKIEQGYSNLGFMANFLSTHNDSDRWNYNANARFYNFGEKGPALENNFYVDAMLSKYVKTELFGATASVDYYSNKNSVKEFNEAILSVSPFVKAEQKKWQAKLGIRLTIESQEGKTHFFPDLHAKYNLIDDILSVYVDIDGKTERNSYKKLAYENPFILATLPIQNTNTPINAVLGVRGNISSDLTFHIAANYSALKDMPLFCNDSIPPSIEQSRFNVIYDNANVYNIHGELAYSKLDKIYVAAKVDYFHYEMEREILPWHKPSFSASISGKYNVENKFWITADVFAIGKQYAKISEKGLPSKSYKRELKGIADINLGIEYLYNKRLNAFLKFNNLGGFRYYRWNNYPTQRFNLLAGISYSF